MIDKTNAVGIPKNSYLGKLLDYNKFLSGVKETEMVSGSLANMKDAFMNYANPELDESTVTKGMTGEAIYSDKGMLNALDNFFMMHRSIFDQQANISNFKYSAERGNRPQMMEVNMTGKQGDYDTSTMLNEHRNYLQNTIPPESNNFVKKLKCEYDRLSKKIIKGNAGTVSSDFVGDANRQYFISGDSASSTARNHNEKGVYGSEGSFPSL